MSPYVPTSEEVSKLGKTSGRFCPLCNSATVWAAGRYSVYHRCSKYLGPNAGCQGKIGAPRGHAAKATTSAPTESPEPEETVVITEAEMIPPKPETKEEPLPTAKETKQEAKAQEGIGGALWQALGPIVRAEISKTAREIAEEVAATKGMGTSKVTWTINEKLFAEVEGLQHKALHEMIQAAKIISAGNLPKNIMLVGPAGCGKTFLAKQFAKAMQLAQFSELSCSAGVAEWEFKGRSIPNVSGGPSTFESVPHLDVFENGGVSLLDEVDNSDANVLNSINSSLANGSWGVPHRRDKPVAIRHENAWVLTGANTHGHGPSRVYAGRNQLDSAFLDRFEIINVDYDRDLETALVGDAKILARYWEVRDRVSELGIRRVFGTRGLLRMAAWVKAGGLSIEKALVRETKGRGWTADECSRVGVRS